LDNFLAYPIEPQRAPPQTDVDEAMRSLARFHRALCKEDQDVIDHLLVIIKDHWPLRTVAENLSAFEFLLLSMLIEQHKIIIRISSEVSSLASQLDTFK
jgi:hypothetical protein